MALHAELAARDADDDLVLDRQNRRGVGLALLRVAVHDRPVDLAGLGVERHEGGVGLVQEDGAVGVGQATVDRVTAHDRDHGRILLRLVLPEDLRLVVEVEGVHDVRERRVHVHHVADDERRALVAAQHAGRERPGDLQVLDVLGVDLVELRVTRIRVVHRLKNLFRRVGDALHDAFIGQRRRGDGRDTCAERKEMYRSHGFLRQVLRVLAARDESGVARTPT